MRHGIAVPRSSTAIRSDHGRRLTQKGAKKIRRAAKGLGHLKISFDLILTSPLPRARQTAQIVAEAFDLEEKLEQMSELRPEGTPQALLAGLTPYRKLKRILLVGHQPLLGKAASFLLADGKEIRINLKKGGVCLIELEELRAGGPALLHWLLNPGQLRLLGDS